MHAQSGSEKKSRGFGHFLSAIRERWWVVVLTMVVIGGLAYGVSLLVPPRYAATAQLAYSADDAQLASQALSSAGTTQSSRNVANDALMLQTSAFSERVSEAMGNRFSPRELRDSLVVTADVRVDVIEVRASGSEPTQVAEIANAFADEFVRQRQENTSSSLLQAQELLRQRIEGLSPEEAASAYGVALKQRHDDLAVLLSLEVRDYSVLQEATAPDAAYFPRPLFNSGMGLIAGLVLGLLLALLLDYFDRRIKNPVTLEQIMELPVIGAVPLVGRRSKRTAPGANPAVGFGEGNETLLESMRMLRSNLKALGFGESKRSVLVTSVTADEGKSTLAVNLAISMALAGDRVVLVDANLRSPTIHEYLGLNNDRGLGDVLLDREVSWTDRIQAVELSRFVPSGMMAARETTGGVAPVSRFVCLTSGTPVGNPSEVLESGAMLDVLAELQGISDYVILDGPALLVSPEALILARSVDALVLASALGRETAAETAQVKQLLDRAELTTLGIVLFGAKSPAQVVRHQIADRAEVEGIVQRTH